MITEFSITDLGVIPQAHLTLSPGFTVITGETGAGKTMVLSGLALLLGRKARLEIVRTGSDRATAEGRLLLPAGSAALARAQEAGADLDDDGSLLISRTVWAGKDGSPGRSRAYLGGRSVPQSVLGEVADELVTVHGQSDQLRLRSAAAQLAALDEYAGPQHSERLASHRELWQKRYQLAQKIADLQSASAELQREVEVLQTGLDRIAAAELKPGEDEDLRVEAERLSSVAELRQAVGGAHAVLDGSEEGTGGVSELLGSALRELERVADADPALGELLTRLRDLSYQAGDISVELSSYLHGLSEDPQRLDLVQSRIAELTALKKLYGPTLADVAAWETQASNRLLELDMSPERLQTLQDQLAALDDQLAASAATLTAAREQAAVELSEQVSAELAGLAMGAAKFTALVRPGTPGAGGNDEVEFQLADPAGAPRPISRTASGGELSRLMLALEVSLAAKNTGNGTQVGTFVFDEVDSGIGGATALRVGQRLRELAEHHQVIVVTHLAQVAAYAQSHLVVRKTTDAESVAEVTEVQDNHREEELARMLGGTSTQAARQHAAELLQQVAS